MDIKKSKKIIGIKNMHIDDLPEDELIKESIKERKEIAMRYETEKDDHIDSDSDAEGMEQLWDELYKVGEPYGNSIEHLKKLLEGIPKRLSTREIKLYLKYSPENYDKKYIVKMENVINTRLEADIDEDIVKEGFERMRVRIKRIIEKKDKEAKSKIEAEEVAKRLKSIKI